MKKINKIEVDYYLKKLRYVEYKHSDKEENTIYEIWVEELDFDYGSKEEQIMGIIYDNKEKTLDEILSKINLFLISLEIDMLLRIVNDFYDYHSEESSKTISEIISYKFGLDCDSNDDYILDKVCYHRDKSIDEIISFIGEDIIYIEGLFEKMNKFNDFIYN